MFSVLVFVFCISGCIHLVTNEEVGSSGNGPNSIHQNSKPPIDRVLKVYIYNITNSDDFLTKGSKLIVKELGPYVYVRKWDEAVNDQDKFGQEQFYKFNETLSKGHENDLVFVPNIPILMYILMTQSNSESLDPGLGEFFTMLKEEPFVNVTVQQFLWGYESPLLTFTANFAQRPGQPIIHEKNFKGAIDLLRSESIDFVKYGLIDSSKQCNKSISLDRSDFSGNLNENSVIYAFNENFCRTIPLSYEKSISEKNDVTACRFVAKNDAFSDKSPLNPCYCVGKPPCPPSTPTNNSQCGYVSFFPLTFPHFYLSNDSYRTAVEGISPPDPEKHKFYIDVQPATGIALNVRARLQLNLAMPRVEGFSQGGVFPKMTLPVLWFEEGNY